MAGLGAARLRLNGVVLLVVGGLAVLVWWLSAQKDDGVERLFSGTYENINLITLERLEAVAGVKKIRFEKKGTDWQMVVPQQRKVNPTKVRQLFSLLSEPVAATYDSAGRDLVQYGLQPGRVILRFNEQQFVLGVINTVSGQRYVLHNNKIKLVSEAVFGLATGEWEVFLPQDLSGVD